MNIRRSAVGAAVLANRIYVVGGYDGNSSLNSVECYDPEMNQWKFVASMSTLRSAAGVTSLNGLCFVFVFCFFYYNKNLFKLKLFNTSLSIEKSTN